jgi:hypothetical protein
MHPTKFRFIWQSGFRGEDFLEINQSITRIACGGRLLTNRDEMNNGNRQGSYTFFVRKFHDFSRTFPGFFLVFPGPTLNKMSTSISEILSNHIIYHVLTFVHVYECIRNYPS